MATENVVYIYVENYSDFKKNKLLPFVTIWINPENTMLSKLRQSKKEKYCLTPLT